ncbi:WhiB family transcriptional regulator [Streptomyces bacillaris]|uniref:WhiB family transcriptional regulator n=1 Tax=Streptomyces bacillaris TaxID=68179 RepID=UPI003D7263DE
MSTDLSWRDSALCAQTDPEAYYPEVGGSAVPAKRTCMACPVTTECREYALATGQRWGVWGGLTQKELRRLINQRTAA